MAEKNIKKVTKKLSTKGKEYVQKHINFISNKYADRSHGVGDIRSDLIISAEFDTKHDKEAVHEVTYAANAIIEECLFICRPSRQYPKLLLFWDSKKSKDVAVISNINNFIKKTGYDLNQLYRLDNETFSEIKEPSSNDIDYDGYKFVKYVRNSMMSEGLEKTQCFEELEQIVSFYNGISATSNTLDIFIKELIYDYLAEKVKEADKQFLTLVYGLIAITLIVYLAKGTMIALGLAIVSTLFMLPNIFRAHAISDLTLSNPMSASYFNLKQEFDALKRAKIKVDPQLDNIINEIDKKLHYKYKL
jgi:hypothetical protein